MGVTGEPDSELTEGLYESVVTTRLLHRLARQADLDAGIARVDAADEPEVLARHIRSSLLRALESRRTSEERVDLIARLLDLLAEAEDAPSDEESGVRQLLSLTRPAAPGVPSRFPHDIRPSTPLAAAALLTNSPGEPSLGAELRSELDTCDGVDLLCAFVMWPGLRILQFELRRLRERGAPLRIITTTYLGGTERVALDRLARDYGAQIRVQYDARRTRLHAKAWMFHRETGFDTAYVGSSNLSRAALLDGVEWNVRLSRIGTPTLLEKFLGTFESYWNSDMFEPYDPDRDRDRLDDALRVASGSTTSYGGPLTLSGLEVRPYPHQTAILEALDAERVVHDRHRNLVVAATGTGKTVIAALDYRRLCGPAGERPRLLFVAHRREILDQSLRTYREVLGDATFGESFVGGARPERWAHVFASVQSLTAYGVANLPPDAFDVVVIDEFHHAEAATYRRILDRLAPRELLGLTATPERGDGTDVRALFGGRTAAELRLWDAISSDLLSPFHYFGVADGTDISRVAWHAGRYDEGALERLYTGNDARARIVLNQVEDTVTDPHRMRAIGFCVGVKHAEYMAETFRRAGLSALAVSGVTPASARAQAIHDLRSGRLNALFAADLLNEGVDIPEVDTILLLRPTESPTVFLQQLGRGLRLAEGKAVLTVLDFVGTHRAEFRLDLRFRVLTGTTRRGLAHAVETGFPFLPSGSQIVLERQVSDAVLRNIRENLGRRWTQLVGELRSHPTDALHEFLQESGLELADVIKPTTPKHSWTALRRAAGTLPPTTSPLEEALVRRVRAVTHVDDPARASLYARLLRPGAPAYAQLSPREQALARMLFFTLWPGGGGFETYDAGLASLAGVPDVCSELDQIIELSLDATRHVAPPTSTAVLGLPLAVHARYQREEILAALGHASLERVPNTFREGVVSVPTPAGPVDAFFITLRKSEADYSPTTMYRDRPISPTLFHWESQSTTSVDSQTGRRYRDGSSTILLFVRRDKTGEFGTAPYVFLGPATYVSHTGSRPIAITWRLRHPMPADLYLETAVAL